MEAIPVEEILFDDPEIANLMREYSSIKNSIKEYGTAEKRRNQEAES